MKTYIIIFLLFISQAAFSQIVISWPVYRSVFQRDNSGNATVIIAGQVPAVWNPAWQLQYKIDRLDRDAVFVSSHTGWTNLPTPGLGKVFRITQTMSTGWYDCEVRLITGSTVVYSYTVRFGVGEVFIIAGQSNAAGEGSISYTNATYTQRECIIVSPQTSINKCSGTLPIYPYFHVLDKSTSYIGPSATQPWAYNRLATTIVDNNHASGTTLPIMFFNTALSGTSSEDWSITADDPTIARATNYSINRCSAVQGGHGFDAGEPYRSLRNSLNYYGSLFGCRGIIWHQGETDNTNNVSTGTYDTNLQNVIQKSRDHFNSNLAWAVSSVSWDGATQDTLIKTGQYNSKVAKSGVTGAIYSDGIVGTKGGFDMRQTDNIHFTYDGLVYLANQYLSSVNSLLSKTPISASANQLVPVTITQSGSNKIIDIDFASMGKVSTDFSCYQWTTGDDYTSATYPLSGCTTTYTSKTVTTDGIWRCYMRDAKGNVFMTQKLTIKTNPNIRVGASLTNSKVFPNPSNKDFENIISFELEETSIVRLELMNEKGEVIQTLANGIHKDGKYNYPFSIKTKRAADFDIYYYRLTINDSADTQRIIIE